MKNTVVTLRVSKVEPKRGGILFRISTSQEKTEPIWVERETSTFFDSKEEQRFAHDCVIAIKTLVGRSLWFFDSDQKCKFKMIFPNDLYGQGEVSFSKEQGGKITVHYFDKYLKMNETEQEYFLSMFHNIEY